MEVGEEFVQYLFKKVLEIDIPLPLPRLTYKEAMERYGSDKPDTRFGIEICDLTDLVKIAAFPSLLPPVKPAPSARSVFPPTPRPIPAKSWIS